MEQQGAATPGLLVLTTGLSKPFRRLDKYSSMLQELERHMESSHQDRGDTQRSVSVYKDIAVSFYSFAYVVTSLSYKGCSEAKLVVETWAIIAHAPHSVKSVILRS